MTASATNPTRHSSGSMPLYSASPPQTPPSTLSVALRRSAVRAAGAGGGAGGGGQGGGSEGAGSRGGGADGGGGAAVMAGSVPLRRGAAHRGKPPFLPGPRTRVITGAAPGPAGATIGP